MRKIRIEYNSPVDALVNLAKRLSEYEQRFNMETEIFFDRYTKGQMEDSMDYIDWANDYQHYMAFKLELEKRLRDVA